MVRPFGKLRTHHQRILLDFAIVLGNLLQQWISPEATAAAQRRDGSPFSLAGSMGRCGCSSTPAPPGRSDLPPGRWEHRSPAAVPPRPDFQHPRRACRRPGRRRLRPLVRPGYGLGPAGETPADALPVTATGGAVFPLSLASRRPRDSHAGMARLPNSPRRCLPGAWRHAVCAPQKTRRDSHASPFSWGRTRSRHTPSR